MTGFITVDGTDDWVSTGDKAQLDIAGDFEAIAYVRSLDYTGLASQTILSKWAGSYRWVISTIGRLEFTWNNGVSNFTANSPVNIAAADGVGTWLRITGDVDDGAGDALFSFYESADPPETLSGSVSWSSLGTDDNNGATTSIANSASPLLVGIRTSALQDPFNGDIHVVELYDGIGGTLVANPDFRTGDQGWASPPGTDDVGNDWAFVGDTFWTPPTGGVVGRNVTLNFATNTATTEAAG